MIIKYQCLVFLKVDLAQDPVQTLEASVQAPAPAQAQALVQMQHSHQMSQRHLEEFLALMVNSVVVSLLTKSVMTHLVDQTLLEEDSLIPG